MKFGDFGLCNSVYNTGIKIVIDDVAMSEMVEDWSRVRSPSRAMRRRRQGHRQNIGHKVAPKKEAVVIRDKAGLGETWVVHSSIYDQIKRETATLALNQIDRVMGNFVTLGNPEPDQWQFRGLAARPEKVINTDFMT